MLEHKIQRKKASLRAFRKRFPNIASDTESEDEDCEWLDIVGDDYENIVDISDVTVEQIRLTFTNCRKEHDYLRHVTARGLKFFSE